MEETTMTNMTEGKPFKILLRFAIPLLLGIPATATLRLFFHSKRQN